MWHTRDLNVHFCFSVSNSVIPLLFLDVFKRAQKRLSVKLQYTIVQWVHKFRLNQSKCFSRWRALFGFLCDASTLLNTGVQGARPEPANKRLPMQHNPPAPLPVSRLPWLCYRNCLQKNQTCSEAVPCVCLGIRSTLIPGYLPPFPWKWTRYLKDISSLFLWSNALSFFPSLYSFICSSATSSNARKTVTAYTSNPSIPSAAQKIPEY